jgi:hypothetical protein
MELGHGTPVKGKDSLQQYCHQNPVKRMVDNTLKSELQLADLYQKIKINKKCIKEKVVIDAIPARQYLLPSIA